MPSPQGSISLQCVWQHLRLFKVLSQQTLMPALYDWQDKYAYSYFEAKRAPLQRGDQRHPQVDE